MQKFILVFIILLSIFFSCGSPTHDVVDELLSSIKTNDFTRVVTLIENGKDINTRDKIGRTALMYASKYGFFDISEFLISKGADINAKNGYGKTALMYAAQNGYIDIVKLLMEKKAEVDIADIYGNTALIYASRKDQLEIVQYLVNSGVQINTLNHNNLSALSYAVDFGYAELTRYLLLKGADIRAKSGYSASLLFHAVDYGFNDIAKALIDYGANVNERGPEYIDEKNSDIFILTLATENGNKDIVQYLLEHGAKPYSSEYYESPLSRAIYNYGNEDIIKILLKYNDNPDIGDARGIPLLLAVRKGNLDIIRLLLAKGADINCNGRGSTLMNVSFDYKGIGVLQYLLNKDLDINYTDIRNEHILFKIYNRGNYHFLELLLDHGVVEINKKDDRGFSVLKLAAKSGDKIVVCLLLAYGAVVDFKIKRTENSLSYYYDTEIATLLEKGPGLRGDAIKIAMDPITKLSLAIILKDMDSIKDLVKTGVDLNSECEYAHTFLTLAVQNNVYDIAEYLIDHGAQVNQKLEDAKETVLIYACRIGTAAYVKLLLEKGADPNMKDRYGWSPLMYASYYGDIKKAALLIEHGARVNEKNNLGRNAVMYALDQGGNDIVAYLVKTGADINTKDNSGMSLLHYATLYGQIDMVQFLLENGADINTVDGTGKTPLHIAAYRFKEAELSNVLKYVNVRDARASVYKGSYKPNAVHLLLSHDADITKKDESGNTPVMASLEGKTPYYLIMLNNRPRDMVDASFIQEAFTSAVLAENRDAIIYFFESGANVDKTDIVGNTVLIEAVKKNKLALVTLLIEIGADVTMKNKLGETPLSIAGEQGFTHIEKILLKAGAHQ